MNNSKKDSRIGKFAGALISLYVGAKVVSQINEGVTRLRKELMSELYISKDEADYLIINNKELKDKLMSYCS